MLTRTCARACVMTVALPHARANRTVTRKVRELSEAAFKTHRLRVFGRVVICASLIRVDRYRHYCTCGHVRKTSARVQARNTLILVTPYHK